jgi:hypothetical protein
MRPVSLRDAAELVVRVRRAFEHGVGDVRSNDTVCGLLVIAEQWVDEQTRREPANLIDLSEATASWRAAKAFWIANTPGLGNS